MENKEAIGLSSRYLILIVLGLFKLKLFYNVFTPLTVYPVYGVLSILYENANLLQANLLFFGGLYAQIIPACIAGAAYYLLLILNLTTPMGVEKRLKSIAFLFFIFLVLNITRILIFSGLLVSGYEYFDLTHKMTWYFGSTVLVVAVWFVNVWLFKIKNIPIYTDMKNIFSDVISGKERS